MLTDRNKCDSEKDKQDTDWYKLLDTFGEYAHPRALVDMLGCDYARYWTGTKYENQKGLARNRVLGKDGVDRSWNDTNDNYRVCGFKDSM